MITRVSKSALTTVSKTMVTGGCVLKIGRVISTLFMFARFSRATGHNSLFNPSGKETLMEVLTLVSTMIPKQLKKLKNKTLLSTPVTVGLTILNLDFRLRKRHK